MSGWTIERQKILDRQRAVQNVLVVEGVDDQALIETLLDRLAPGTWSGTWLVGSAGGKTNLFRILDDQANWLGLIDRDEVSAADLAAKQAQFGGRLHVLPRYCMESYFVTPNELWSALPSQQANIHGGLPALEQAIHAGLPHWLRHGVLWHVINPLWDGLHTLGFKEQLLKVENAQSDADIRATLQTWHDYLQPDPLMTEFHRLLAQAQAAPVGEQLQSWIHGKEFFRSHVVPALNRLIRPNDANTWLTELRKDLPLPPDLLPLWRAMGLQ